jgi:outer membrane protein assembly factor BamE
MSKNVLRWSICFAWLMCASACTYLTPYKLPIQQGNIVESESLSKLKSGMTKNQAAQVLGTALLNDVYHANRWDYVHYLKKRGRMSEQKHVALIFEEEKLARLVGDAVPALQPMAVQEETTSTAPTLTPAPDKVDDSVAPEPLAAPAPEKE